MKKQISFNQQAFEKCQSEWKLLIPKYQQIADELTSLGIVPSKELVLDQVNGGSKVIKAYEATLDKAPLEVKVKNILKGQLREDNKVSSGQIVRMDLTESHHLEQKNINNPKYHDDFTLLNKATDELKRLYSSPFLLNLPGEALDARYLSIEKGKVFVSAESWKIIKESYFTVNLENEKQVKAYEQALKACGIVNEVMQQFWEIEDNVLFDELFICDEQGYHPNPEVFKLLN